MRKFLLLIILFVIQIMQAQKVKVLYSTTFDLPDAKYLKFFTPEAIKELKNKKYYYLLYDRKSSIFYPLEKPQEFVDKDTLQISQTKRKITEVVIKNDLIDIYYINYPERIYIRKLKSRGKIYDIKDSLPNIEWTILSDKKKLKNYTLQKAVANYYGIKITAWFTEDIFLNIGPRIFRGLPGLIMELKMNSLNYQVEKIDFVKNLPPIEPPKPDGSYINTKQMNVIVNKMKRGVNVEEKKCENCPK